MGWRSPICPPHPQVRLQSRRGAPATSAWARVIYITGAQLRANGEAPTIGVMSRIFQDDLLSVNSARLRALGVIVPGAATAIVSFGEGADALKREIRVWHREWSHGRGLSLFLCPRCGGKAQILRVYDGAVWCRNCLKRAGVQYKIAYGTEAEQAEARARRIEKLRAKLNGGSLRVHPREGRGIERRRPLELSLKRAMVVERLGLLEEVERWRGHPTK
jgi:hypothetical protein